MKMAEPLMSDLQFMRAKRHLEDCANRQAQNEREEGYVYAMTYVLAKYFLTPDERRQVERTRREMFG
jgi:hypothetical protein